MLSEFQKIGEKLKDNNDFIFKIYNSLPEDIKQIKPFKDLLCERMLYTFGEPITIYSSSVHCFEGIQNHDVEKLYLALRLANKYLDEVELENYITKIKDINNHSNYIFVIIPLLNLKDSLIPKNESDTNHIGNKNVDWEIKNGEYIILLEVKNRIKDTIDYLSYLKRMLKEFNGGINPNEIVPYNSPNPSNLFKSAIKVNERKNDKTLQGIWINTGILQDRKKLNNYFKTLDPKIIQFAIISGWDDDAYILVKDNSYKQILINYFNLIESDNIIMEYNN